MTPDKGMLEINLNELEMEAQELPQQAFVWGKKLASARKKTKSAKNRLKIVAAEVELEVRKAPNEFGLDKATEASVAAVVLTATEYKYQQDQLLELEYEEEILKSFVNALGDKKSMIEAEVKLHGQMYWSKPNMSPEEKGGKEIASKKASAMIKVDRKKV